MINFFQFSTDTSGTLTDASLYYLGRLFGNMYNIIPQAADPQTGKIVSTGNISILSYMFKTFNGTILTVGALIVVYVTLHGTLVTAHEGEFMGRKERQLWTPLRTVMGIAALVPTPTGYSAIQLIMMWVIVQGIGAADVLWSTALNYIGLFGSPYAQASVPQTSSAVGFRDVFKALTCAASARLSNPAGPDRLSPGYFCQDQTCSSVDVYSKDNPSFNIGPSGLCGVLTTCDKNEACKQSDSLKCALCTAQTDQMAIAIPLLQGIADQLALRDYQYRTFSLQSFNKPANSNPDWTWIEKYCQAKNINSDQCCIPTPAVLGLNVANNACKATATNAAFYSPVKKNDETNPSSEAVAYIYWPYGVRPSITDPKYTDDFMGTVIKGYTSALTTALMDYVEKQKKDSKNLPAAATQALQTGWIFAGSYFYVISQMNNKNSLDIPEISVSSVAEAMGGFRTNMDAASVLANMAAGNAPQSNASLGETQNAISLGFNDVGNVLGVLGKSTSSPIAQMQQTGMALLAIVQVMFVAVLAALLFTGLAGWISPFVLGTGLINPAGPAALTVSLLLIPAILALFGIMISLGGLLGVYVPLIPYIIFTFGAIGWMISIVEAMVAGPLVALGILSPSGQHEVLGKAEPALMLLFSIFLRPSLMIFGFFAGILLASVVADMINTAFWTTVAAGIATAGVSTGGQPNAGATNAQAFFVLNPLEGIIFIAAYVSLIVSAMNKCFAAIHVVPEQVMGWISGQAAQRGSGEAEAVSEMKSGVSGAAGRAGSGVSGAHAAGKGRVKGGKQAAKEKAEAVDKAQSQLTQDDKKQ